MGLFRKKEPAESEPGPAEPGPEIEMEKARADLAGVERDVVKKYSELTALSEKLDRVKTEYDTTVGSLMSERKALAEAKKEAALLEEARGGLAEGVEQKRAQLDQAEIDLGDRKGRIEELDRAHAALAGIKEEADRGRAELHDINRRILESQSALDRARASQAEAEAELHNSGEGLKSARDEVKKLSQERDTMRAEIDLAKKEMKVVRGQMESASEGGAKQHVVEAASAMVSSLTQRLATAERELGVIKKVLERERRERGQDSE
ncbi:ATPase involved in DNA repair [Cenarchaeum symbiosum A]|uniref:ATPase involved in DNA repair n=1 Tax=Cenarchaeum symbiosum (strain A) TaxID=414004 RepID=A0RWR9_CENSY|nr:ATPase involved in DNA repair [Cenarchaeum symbiosum A]